MINYQCPICLNNCSREEIQRKGAQMSTYKVSCPQCSDYLLAEDVIQTPTEKVIPMNEVQRGLASGWIRENFCPLLNWMELSNLKKLPQISPRRKAIKLLQKLAKEDKTLDKDWLFDTKNEKNKRFLAYAWAKDQNELAYIRDEILVKQKKWMQRQPRNKKDPITNVTQPCWEITPEGWDFLEQPDNKESVQGFIAMRFVKSLDRIKQVILTAIGAAGFDPLIMDEHEHVNRIDDEIIVQITKSKFLVADLTYQNQGVYFEAGFAIGLNIPVIWTCRKRDQKNVHFDTRQFNTIFWENSDKGLEDFKYSLQNRIVRIVGEGPIQKNRW